MDAHSTNEQYGGFWRRVAAEVIDGFILMIPFYIVGMFTFGLGGLILWITYGTYFESSENRATWGKMACGLTVENESGEQLSLGAALGRQILKLIANIFSIFGWLIFFVPAAFTSKKQGLHDLAVSSVVLREEGKGIPSWAVGLIAGLVPLAAVIGILAAIAIPAYQGYVTKSKIAAVRTQAAPLKQAVENSYTKNGKLPFTKLDLDTIDMPVDVNFRSGRIELSLSGNQHGTIFLTPVEEDGKIEWTCSAEDLKPRSLPKDCQ